MRRLTAIRIAPIPTEDGRRWQVTQDGQAAPLQVASSLEAALEVAFDCARRVEPSKVYYRTEDGQLKTRTFGEEPYPPDQEQYFHYELTRGSIKHEP